MSQSKIKHQDIAKFLQVSPSFISKWCLIYEEQGALALLLNYQNKRRYLYEDDKQEIILFLQQQSHFSVEQWRDHLEEKYQVVYKSKQSYYDLLDAGGSSWKKTKKKIQKLSQFSWQKLKNQSITVEVKNEKQRQTYYGALKVHTQSVQFAPYTPEQNPIEEVWLQGKNFLRTPFYQNKTFAQVKKSFFDDLIHRTFNFKKMSIYF